MTDPLIVAAVDGFVAAVDRSTGQVVWRHDLHDARVGARLRARTTLTLALEPPYVAMVAVTWHEMTTHTGGIASWCVRVACCDYLSGRILWTSAQDVRGHGRSPNITVMQPSVRIEADQVLVGMSTLSAFDAASGRFLWQAAIASAEPEPAKPAGGGFFDALTDALNSNFRYEGWNCQIARRHA